jgi:hypothetical protein
VGLPIGVVALDGKVTALPCIHQRFIQVKRTESGMPYGLVRTVTAALVSAPGRPCIDAIPIPAATNEMATLFHSPPRSVRGWRTISS